MLLFKQFAANTLWFSILVGFQVQADEVPAKVLAEKPPMGWNAWNRYGCNANETLIKQVADALVSTGLSKVGYTYLNLDDCWQMDRNTTTGQIIPDHEKFPSGLKSLSDYVHDKGLKFGIYSSAGTKTCEGRPGSLGYEDIDAQTYADWGVDYLKYDNCFNENLISMMSSIQRYKTMSDAIKKTGRSMIYSVCNWGQVRPWLWAGEFSQLWRTTADIGNTWDEFNFRCSPCLNEDPSTCIYFGNSCSVMNILDKQVLVTEYAKPGGWNNMDMLQVGNGGLTHEEEMAHFSLWAALKSPLIISTDLQSISPESLSILTNTEIIAINQDPLGVSAKLIRRDYSYELLGLKRNIDVDVWGGPLSMNRYVVVLLNRFPVSKSINFSLSELNLKGNFQVKDVWKNKNLGMTKSYWTGEDIPSHGVQVLILTPISHW